MSLIGNPKILRPADRGGYRFVILSDRGGIRRKFYVHRLVAAAFVGRCPTGKEVGHIDHDRSNNRFGNLEYVTRRENLHHAIKAGRAPQLSRQVEA